MKNVVPSRISCCLLSFPASFPVLLSLCCNTLGRVHQGWPLSDQVLMVWISLTPRHPGEATKLVTLTSISKHNSVFKVKTRYLAGFLLVSFGFCFGHALIPGMLCSIHCRKTLRLAPWHTQTFLQDIFSWKLILLLPWWLYNLCQFCLLDLILWSLAQPPHLLS